MPTLHLIAPTLGIQRSGKERATSALIHGFPDGARWTLQVHQPDPRTPLNRHPAAAYVINEHWLQLRARPRADDVLVYPYGTTPLALRTQRPSVTLVLDTFFGSGVRAETRTAQLGSLYRRATVSGGVRRAAVVGTQNEATYRWCRRLAPDAAFVSMRPGIDASAFHPDVIPAIRARPYLLLLAGSTARKNSARQLAACLAVARREDLDVIVLGSLGDEPADDPRLHRIHGISDDTLASLYRGAEAVCLAPMEEGWGLPVLEALAVGARVATSKVPSVVDLAASLAGPLDRYLNVAADPHDVSNIEHAIELAMKSDPEPVPPNLLDDIPRSHTFWHDLFGALEALS